MLGSAMKPDHVAALEKAVVIVGSQAALAAKLSEITGRRLSQQRISYWVTNECFIDAKWWNAFEIATDHVITRRELRPDVFPRNHAA